MENRDVRPALAKPAKKPVKVKSGDFDPEGSSATPLIDDHPRVQGGSDPVGSEPQS